MPEFGTRKYGDKRGRAMKACKGKRGCAYKHCLEKQGIRPPLSIRRACPR